MNTFYHIVLTFLGFLLLLGCAAKTPVDRSPYRSPQVAKSQILDEDYHKISTYLTGLEKALNRGDSGFFFANFDLESIIYDIALTISKGDSNLAQANLKKLRTGIQPKVTAFFSTVQHASVRQFGICHFRQKVLMGEPKIRCPLSFELEDHRFYLIDLWLDIEGEKAVLKDWFSYSYFTSFKTNFEEAMQLVLHSMTQDILNADEKQSMLTYMMSVPVKNAEYTKMAYDQLPKALKLSAPILRSYLEIVKDPEATQNLLALYPDFVGVNTIEMNEALNDERYIDVINIGYKLMEKIDFWAPQLVQNVAVSFMEINQEEKAYRVYRDALEAYPHSEQLHTDFADVLLSYQKYEALCELLIIVHKKFGVEWNFEHIEAESYWRQFTKWRAYPVFKARYLKIEQSVSD